jgi:SHS2 domain-containing protein
MSYRNQNYLSHNTQNPALHDIRNLMHHKTLNSGFRIIEHPSDIGIAAYASSLEGLFEIAAEGMFSIICKTKDVGQVLKKSITIKADTELRLDDLLVLWLERLLYIHETSHVLFTKFEIIKLKMGRGITLLRAIAYGEKIDLKRHEVFISIKAPTYHDLKVSYDDSGRFWSGQVIFDV